MGSSPESVAVVAVPFPAQGHLNQLLHLSLQLAASRGLEVHYAAPAPHVRQARARVHGWDDEALLSIRFHHLGISTYASPPPDPAAELSFPSHFMPLWETYSADARAPLSALLGGLSASRRRVVVLYDLLCSFAAEEAARLPHGEAFGVYCTSVSYMLGKLDAEHRLLRENGLHYLPVHSCVTKEFLDYVYNRAAVEQASASAAGILANTCRALEGDFIDAAAEALAAGGKKLFAVGPFNPRFIWVSRDADRGNIFTGSGESESRHAKLLAEFSRESEGTGLVITGWAPQLEILAHASTAAFMSHCGWNSTMESMSHGKPVLSWPMNCDQPWDAELICKHFKAGILVRPWEKHGEVVPATAIQEVIEKMMVSEEGMAVRQRAKAVGDAVRSAVAVGGSSREDLERFVAHITR
uniref:Glycosyltransferase n=1 Tax=Oryza brachyantha TaxID=4533 RepID=J3M0A4_ORYBR